jgi:hypothetical protein
LKKKLLENNTMKHNGYKIVSEISASAANLLLTTGGAAKGAVSGHVLGSKIGIIKYNRELKKARSNVIKAQQEEQLDPQKSKDVELALNHLHYLLMPETRKEIIKRYTRYGELSGTVSGAATGILAHKVGSAIYNKILKK